MDSFLELLKSFMPFNVVGGREDIGGLIAEKLKDYADEVYIDALGSVIATKNGINKKGLKIMIDAHMDGVGLMIKHIEENGFLRYVEVGSWDPRGIKRVIVHTTKGPVRGVIGSRGAHLEGHLPQENKWRIPDPEDTYIDIGATSREEVEQIGVKIGDSVTYETEVQPLGNSRVISGKYFDCQVCLAILIETFRQLKNLKHEATIYGVGTVQEEGPYLGAATTSYEINPDMAIELDIALAGDTPEVNFREAPLKVGGGPVITIMHKGLINRAVADKRIVELMVKTAIENKIPYQLEVIRGMSTDAVAIQKTRSGIPFGGIEIATRYTHSPFEVASLDDIENATKLLVATLLRVKDNFQIGRVKIK